MIRKSHGRISIFGEHSDWLTEYKDVEKSIPDEIIGLSGSIDLGLEYEIERKSKPVFEMFENYNGDEIHITLNYDLSTSISDYSRRLVFFAVKAAINYMISITNYGDVTQFNGCYMKIKKCTLPSNKGLASSTCLISAIIESILIVNDIPVVDLAYLVYSAESRAVSTIGGLDMIVTESPGIRMVHYYSATGIVKYDPDILDKNNSFMKNSLAIIDTGEKSATTNDILSSLQSPFNKEFSYIAKSTIANLFGESTTNFSKLGKKAIQSNDVETLGILMWEFQKMYTYELESLRLDIEDFVFDYKANIFLKNALKSGAIHGGKCMGSHGDTAILVAVKDLEKLKQLTTRGGYKLYPL